jgi:3-oxoacyl-[acyl-carrier protein] reductase
MTATSARPPVPPAGHALLAGKAVVITAAAGAGIGAATARRCLEEGARVLISDQHLARLTSFRDELAAEHGDRIRSAACDVTDESAVTGLVAEAVRQFGRIDITLNSAFRGTRAALRQMVAQGDGGVVINNSSVLGWRAQGGQAHYAAAKAGVMALTRCAAMDVASHGIRVNAVAPSLATHPFLAKVTSPELLAELESREAFGRGAQPWEVANVIVFLASDYSSYLTGEVISVSSQHP